MLYLNQGLSFTVGIRCQNGETNCCENAGEDVGMHGVMKRALPDGSTGLWVPVIYSCASNLLCELGLSACSFWALVLPSLKLGTELGHLTALESHVAFFSFNHFEDITQVFDLLFPSTDLKRCGEGMLGEGHSVGLNIFLFLINKICEK